MTADRISAAISTTLARAMMALAEGDKLIALEWLERAVAADADDIQRGLLANILDGTATFVVKDGQMAFRLTPQGMAEAERLIVTDPDAQRMLAELLKATRVDGPKEPQ